MFCGLVALSSGVMPAAIAQSRDPEALNNKPPTAEIPASQKPPAQIGDATNAMLQMQADGSQAAPTLPTLGPAAELSWQRYLNSYKYPIPESYGNKIQKIGSGQ